MVAPPDTKKEVQVMQKQRRQQMTLVGFAALLLGIAPAVVSAQETAGDADDNDRNIRQFALNNQEETELRTGLRWVDSDQAREEGSAEEASSREERTSEPERREASGADGSEPASEDAEFERLASAGRDSAEKTGDESLGMEDATETDRDSTGSSRSKRAFDVQLGEKSVGEVIDLYRKNLVNCYQKRAEQRSDLGGRVVLEVVVEADGSLRSAGVKESSLNDGPTEKCMVETLRSMEYPSTESGTPTTWTIPFRFLN